MVHLGHLLLSGFTTAKEDKSNRGNNDQSDEDGEAIRGRV